MYGLCGGVIFKAKRKCLYRLSSRHVLQTRFGACALCCRNILSRQLHRLQPLPSWILCRRRRSGFLLSMPARGILSRFRIDDAGNMSSGLVFACGSIQLLSMPSWLSLGLQRVELSALPCWLFLRPRSHCTNRLRLGHLCSGWFLCVHRLCSGSLLRCRVGYLPSLPWRHALCIRPPANALPVWNICHR